MVAQRNCDGGGRSIDGSLRSGEGACSQLTISLLWLLMVVLADGTGLPQYESVRDRVKGRKGSLPRWTGLEG